MTTDRRQPITAFSDKRRGRRKHGVRCSTAPSSRSALEVWLARSRQASYPVTNGLLKSFLNNRRAFRNRETAQAHLSLLVLWHNMRVCERGKRADKSPYQWAGIDPGTDDWLELLGYPADA